MLQLKYKQKGK